MSVTLCIGCGIWELGRGSSTHPSFEQSSDSLSRMILADINSFQELGSSYYCWEEGQLSVFLLCKQA